MWTNRAIFNFLIHVTMLVTIQLTKAAITGPMENVNDIKISNKKSSGHISSQKTKEFHRHIDDNIKEESLVSNLENSSSNIKNTSTERPNSKILNTKLKIIEPPDGSVMAGGNFYVRVEIQSSDKEEFERKYIEDQSGRVCVTLDEGPFHCWPIENGRIFYSQATEGTHTIVAKLSRNDKLDNSTTSERHTFSTVSNPDIDSLEETKYQNEIKNKHPNKIEENVDVMFPIVNVISPLEKVSYEGTSITLKTRLNPPDKEMFEKYFKHAFTCYNIDIATAHACFPLFTNHTVLPIVTGLGTGMHTIQAALSHPSNGNLLLESSVGTKMFFVSGDSNEAAAFTADVNIRGKMHRIPIVHGGSIASQTHAFCHDIGLEKNDSCTKLVYDLLASVSKQHGVQVEI